MAEIVDLEQVLDTLSAFSPLRRVLLATAGTLQGTLSAYFGALVTVNVISQDEEPNDRFRREVELVCEPRALVAARAVTEIDVSDPRIEELIREKHAGLGQIIARLQANSSFDLEDAGQNDSTFWRRYRLAGDGFVFRIAETFPDALYT